MKTGKQDIVDWAEPPLQRWLGTITRPGTKYQYKSAFRRYTQFTGKTATTLIDEAFEDAKRDPREKQDIVLYRLLEFYQWLKTECPKKSRGKGSHRITGKGLSDKLAHTYVNAIRSFYATFGIVIRFRGRHRLPKPRIKNKRMKINAGQVRILMDHARTPRDRAIIITLFQSGMDVSTLCNLTYGDIAEGLQKDEHPLRLDLYRPKTGMEYYAFLGRDAVESIRAYIADMKSRGVTFNHDTPLFLKERGKAKMTTNLVQNMMREVALRSGLIDQGNNGKAFNPLGPHALRESFGSIMTNSGVPDTIVDFWLGHEIGEMAKAYKAVQFESLKGMYLEREKLISVSAPKVDVEELKEELERKAESKYRETQDLLQNMWKENLQLKDRIQKAEDKLSKLEELVKQLSSSISKNKRR